MLLISCQEEVEVTELEFEDNLNQLSGANKEQSIKAYKESVYPIVTKNCSSCHGDGGTYINFAVSNATKGHDVLLESGKVNLSLATQSRLYLRLKNDQHNCWTGCDEAAEEMLTALKSWLANIYKENAGIETGTVSFKDGVEKLSKTVRGSIVLEAEDAFQLNDPENTNPDADFLQGRYLINHKSEKNKDSYASGLTYVGGYNYTNHPFEGTPRTLVINDGNNNSTACLTISEGRNINDNSNGRIVYRETFRHPNQDGHRPYAVEVRFQPIRPDRKSEYQSYLVQKGYDVDPAQLRLDNYLIITGELEDGMYDGNPLAATTMFMVLPDFKSASEYRNEVENSDNDYSKNYFAPRYGTPAIQYFNPQNKDMRSNLTSAQKEMIFERFKDRMRDLVLRDDGTPENPSNVPDMIRNMSFPGKDREYTVAPSETRLDLQEIADKYVAFFLSGVTKENILNHVVVYSDNNSRQVYPNISYRYDNVTYGESINLSSSNVSLDNSSIFASSDVDYRKIALKHFTNTVHKNVLRANNCMNCHGAGGNQVKHSTPDPDQAYDNAIDYINLTNPIASRFYDRMKNDRHNCGNATNCDKLANDFVTEITNMNNLVAPEYAAALANPSFAHADLTAHERSPGRVRLPFHVTEAGDYTLWTRTRNTGNIRVRLLTEDGKGIQRCRKGDLSCKYPEERGYSNSGSCVDWNKPDSTAWEWYTPNYNDPNQRMIWRIKPGKYTLELIESEVGTLPQIDLVAFSKDDLFDPSTNIADEAMVQAIKPKELKYDISQIIGAPGYFSIEVDRFGADSYRFRNPRIIGNNQNVIISGITVSISDVYSKTNTSFKDIDFIAGTEGEPITNASLLAQEIFGPDKDFFKFSFDLIKTTTASESQIPKEDLTAFNNRECKHLEQFEKTVFPILTQFKLVYRHEEEGENTYNFYRMPGSERDAATSMTFFTCTSCHNEDHPYFKMTTFFERNQDGSIKSDSLKKFCSQALSRVKFDSPATSLLLRGFEGKANHKRLHIMQEAVPVKSNGRYTGYKKKTNSIDGYESTWRGRRFQKYTESDLNLSAYSGANKAYLEKFVGMYKIYRYQTINDPAARSADGRDNINGDIRVQSDSNGYTSAFDIDGNEVHLYPDPNNSTNLYTVFDPRSELSKAEGSRFNPASIVATANNNNRILMADGCHNTRMQENGITTDPCFGGVDADQEFDQVKNVYRDVILDWILREKASGGY